jgi:ANTAR domain-containing protein
MDDSEQSRGSTRSSRADVDAYLGGMAAASGETFDADETAATALELLRVENAHLEQALRTRAVIGQATGLLMSQQHLTALEAFARLVEISSHTNVKLREVAARLVEEADVRNQSRRPTL